MSHSWPRVRQLTLADQAYRASRTRILNGQLAMSEFGRELSRRHEAGETVAAD